MGIELILGLLVGIVLGVAAGAGLCWYAVSERLRRARDIASDCEKDFIEEKTRAKHLKNQLAQADAEVVKLRESVRKYETNWVSATTELRESRRQLEEQRALVEKAKAELSKTFQSLAQNTLQQSQAAFLQLATDKFNALKTQATTDLDIRRAAIETLVQPMTASLAAYEKATQELEAKRQKELGLLGEQLRAVAATQSLLHTETSRLVQALKSPQVRGRWGEVTLKRTAELVGMHEYCDFQQQVSVAAGEDGPLRPDMIVRLPADREVVVDSKVPLGGFLEAIEALTDECRTVALQKHAKQVLAHVDRLSAKEYWSQFAGSPEFVVLFIPNDSFLAAAAEQNPALVEYALGKKIVLATPTTFVALLRAVEYGWQQRRAIDNAQRIRNLGQELYDHFAVLVEHLSRIGSSLSAAVRSYNSAVGSFESRILPAARRFRELGAKGRKEIEELETLDVCVRSGAEVELEGDIRPD
jgi:DNA recombination protein RmuC